MEALEVFFWLLLTVPPVFVFIYNNVYPSNDESSIDGPHYLRKRGEVSPSNSELLINTIGFGVVSIILFVMRM